MSAAMVFPSPIGYIIVFADKMLVVGIEVDIKIEYWETHLRRQRFSIDSRDHRQILLV